MTVPIMRILGLLIAFLFAVVMLQAPLAAAGGKFVVAFDGKLLGKDNQVWDMAVFGDSLYALACNRPMETRGGKLLKFDEKKWTVVHNFTHDDGVYRMFAGKDRLFIAGSDSAKGTFGWIYLWDGKKMAEIQVKVGNYQTDHNIDVACYKGSIFVANALKFPGGGPARIFRSDDAGKTWVESFTKGLNWHPNALFPTKTRLYAAVGQVVYLEDRKSTDWKEIKVEGQTKESVAKGYGLKKVSNQIIDFAEHAEQVFACGDSDIWVTKSGKEFSYSLKGQDCTFWGMASHNKALYAVSGERILTSAKAVKKDGSRMLIPYGAPGAEYIEPDGKNDAQVWQLSEKGAKWKKIVDLPEDRALSIVSFKKRLYVGTGTRGKIYVLKEAGKR